MGSSIKTAVGNIIMSTGDSTSVADLSRTHETNTHSQDLSISASFSRLSMDTNSSSSSLSSQHPILCKLLATPCQDSLIVITRRQQSQTESILDSSWPSKQPES